MTAITIPEALADITHLATVLDRDVDDLVLEALLEYVDTRQAEADRTIRRLLTRKPTRTLDDLAEPLPVLEYEREEALERAALAGLDDVGSDAMVTVLAAARCAARRRPSPDPFGLERRRA